VLSERDVALARQISASARELGVPVDLTGLQIVQVAIDALVIPDVLPFWRAVLGYQEVGDEDLLDPHLRGPPFWFQQMDAPRPGLGLGHLVSGLVSGAAVHAIPKGVSCRRCAGVKLGSLFRMNRRVNRSPLSR
jgi:hypothetical protein